MSTKKFEAVNESGRALRVIDRGEWVQVIIGAPDERDMGIALAPSDAPALALAILEGAGYTEDDTEGTTGLTHFALAMSNLRAGIEEQERITAEAEAQAKLEAEALDFLNVMRHANGSGPMPSFESLGTLTKRDYLAIARRAREMRAEK